MKLLGLREHPFAAAHDPRFVHPTPERDEALARLRQGLSEGESFLLVTGEPGIGKTSLVLQAFEEERAATAFTQPGLEPRELLEEVCLRFGIQPPKGASNPQRMARLERYLKELRARSLTPVLAMDDAQRASPELLEELRGLSNLEMDGRPLMKIVLMGLPELERRLAGPDLERVRQKVGTHCALSPLSAAQTEGFLHTRVAAAGGDGAALFPAETCLEIHRLARGVPRAICTIAGEALLRASREQAASVAPTHVRGSAADSWLRNVADAPVADTGTVSATQAAPARPPAEAAHPAPAAEDDAPTAAASPGEVKAWVSRFVDPERPLRIGGQILAERAAEASRREWEEVHGPTAAEEEAAEEEAAPPPPPPRRRKPLRGSKRGTRRASRGRWPLAVGGVIAASVAVFLGARWTRRSFVPEARTASAPSPAETAPAVTAVPAAPAPAAPSSRQKSKRAKRAADARAVAASPTAAARRIAAANPLTAGGPASAEAAPPAVRARRGIEAGTYLNFERADSEKALLAESTGLPVQVVPATEDGATVYKVVIGSFGSRRKAQAALNDLVNRGLVEQAKVVALPESDSTTP